MGGLLSLSGGGEGRLNVGLDIGLNLSGHTLARCTRGASGDSLVGGDVGGSLGLLSGGGSGGSGSLNGDLDLGDLADDGVDGSLGSGDGVSNGGNSQ